MAKKYIIELTEKQARLLSHACDQFPRLIQGQDSSFRQLMENAWQKRCKEVTGELTNESWDGGWHTMVEDAENVSKYIKYRFWHLPDNAIQGPLYEDNADIIWDIHQAIRYELWKNDSDASDMIVDAFPPVRSGSEPIVKVISKEE